MKKKVTSLALAIVMCLSLCVPAFAANSNASVQSTLSEGETIEVRGSGGEIYRYDVEYTADSVITTYTDGTETTVMELIYKTGETITTVYESNAVITRAIDINESVRIANKDAGVAPALAFPSSYQTIGSVTFKTNDTGVAYKVSVQCKELEEGHEDKYNLNENLTQELQYLITGLIGYLNPLSWLLKPGELVGTIIDALVSAGVVKLGADSIIEKVTADYVEGYYTKYAIKYENQYGATGNATGTAVYIKTEGARFETVAFDDMYPQFLKEQDEEVARMLYFNFDSYAFPGIRTWSATRTVGYCTSD